MAQRILLIRDDTMLLSRDDSNLLIQPVTTISALIAARKLSKLLFVVNLGMMLLARWLIFGLILHYPDEFYRMDAHQLGMFIASMWLACMPGTFIVQAIQKSFSRKWQVIPSPPEALTAFDQARHGSRNLGVIVDELMNHPHDPEREPILTAAYYRVSREKGH